MPNHTQFILNEKLVSTDEHPGTVLLDYIRTSQRLTGTKEGCKEGDCGACTVIVGELQGENLFYRSINSCLCPLGNVNGKHVVTIEGLNLEGLNLIQSAFHDEAASQCGFCTPGFIVSAVTYLINNTKPDIDSFINAIGGNVCRCTGYTSIKRSLEKIISEISNQSNQKSNVDKLIQAKVLPEYFRSISEKLFELNREIVEPEEKISKFLIGGGTDLFVQIPDDIPDAPVTFSVNKLESEIIEIDGTIKISGASTFEEINESGVIKRSIPEINKYMKLIASLPIRNSATIAGNLVNASPIGDLTIMMLVLGARLTLTDGRESRNIKLSDFYKGYKTLDKSDDEILEWIEFDIPGHDSKINFEKVSKRTHLDIASVNSAAMIKVEDGIISKAIISAGGVAPVPLVLNETSSFLEGNALTAEIIQRAIELALREISPISDIRGSSEYKSLLTGQMIKSHFMTLYPESILAEELI